MDYTNHGSRMVYYGKDVGIKMINYMVHMNRFI